jgi:hypothetical protein
MAKDDNISPVITVTLVTCEVKALDAGVKITQSRIPAPLYERVKERAHEVRQSINRTACELMEAELDRLEREKEVAGR